MIPPGPADFVHNASNASEFIRAEVNAYVESNIIRDFTLGFNPATGEVREIFTQGQVGSDMDAIITDISIILSILLQHGVDP